MVDMATLSPPADPSSAIIRLPELAAAAPAPVTAFERRRRPHDAHRVARRLGKTTLRVDWFTNERTIRRRVGDARPPAQRAGRVASASAAALGFDTLAQTTTGPDTIVLDQLFGAIEERGVPAVLVLDDVHELGIAECERGGRPPRALRAAAAHPCAVDRAPFAIRIHRLRLAGRLSNWAHETSR